jgi:hypothetical protein
MAGTIAISRKSSFQVMPRAYKVWIDGVVVGTVQNGQSTEFSVESGDHTVELSIDGMYSRKLAVEVFEGGRRRIACGPNGMLAFTAFAMLLPGLAIRLTLTH